jgi:RHS repeat-associated protein
LDGEIVQHIEYVPFGEVFIEERNNTWNTPYLFNAKELDEETGLYYYGARYYDPRVSLWLSADALATYDPFEQENFIDGQHNGGVYNSFNHGVYTYCNQNPVRLIDPNGKQVDAITDGVASGNKVTNDITATVSRAPMKKIEGIVLHRTAGGSTSSAINTSKGNKGRTGFHLIIGYVGSTTQLINMNNRANHVGKQKTDIGNSNSIGIEVVGKYDSKTEKWESLTPEQIESTAMAVHTLMEKYNLSIENVYPHEKLSWKTLGEGQIVLDAISNRVNELGKSPYERMLDSLKKIYFPLKAFLRGESFKNTNSNNE